MFNFIYLDKKNNLIDIRLKTNFNQFTFHTHMENLGYINIGLVLCWELGINLIKIDQVIGEIKFDSNYSNYNIYIYDKDVVDSDNLIEFKNESIRIKYNNHDFNFGYGFLNYKQVHFPIYKAKVRCDIILSNGQVHKKEKHQENLAKLSNNKQDFMVLATESEFYPNTYKLFTPDIGNKSELKYGVMIEKQKPKIIIKPKSMETRSYCLLFYSLIGKEYLPTKVLYLSGTKTNYPDYKIVDTEFQSILYNCLPTPKFSNKELKKISEYYQSNDNKYRDLSSSAIAIDPPGSKDKDDAINFNIVKHKGRPVFLEMFVHISDVPPVLNEENTKYHFYYAFHKMETDYMYGARYPMIDPKLSESKNSLSLIGPNKRSNTVKTTYKFKPDLKNVFDIPESVEMYLEKNIKIFATTYESIATGLTDYNKDLPVKNDYTINHKLKYANEKITTLNPIPCEDKSIDISKMFWENKSDIKDSDAKYLNTQLNQLTQVYGTLLRSLSITQEIKPILQSKQYYNDDYQFDLREEWVHRLIEITALETNKYASLILYDKIKNKKFGIDENKLIGKLNMTQIKDYNEYFSDKSRFIGTVDQDEGIFRALYYDVKGHNDSPKYIREKCNQCLPANLIPDVKDMDKLTDLPNLYLKFQLDRLGHRDTTVTPLQRLLNSASFSQTSENLGIALYSTGVRPHLNAKLYYYTYFTSPMRRIVDSLVQTCLIADEEKCNQTIKLFKRHILNRTDINSQCEKYNLYLSVCNKIFGKFKKYTGFQTYYIKYGSESFNNLYLPNLDITISVPSKLKEQLQPEGIVNIKFKQLTEQFDIEVVPVEDSISLQQVIDEQKQLYFKNEKYPDIGTHNYIYLNYRFGL